MRAWLDALAPRDRRALSAGAVVVAAVLFYLLLWAPLAERTAHAERVLQEKKTDLAWMQQAANELRALRARQTGRPGAQGPLLSLLDRTAKRAGIRTAIRRIQPLADDKARLTVKEVAFDRMIPWLDDLQRRYDVRVYRIAITGSEDRPGTVTARVVLRDTRQ